MNTQTATPSRAKKSFLTGFSRIDAHHRFIISVIVASICYVVFFGHLQWGKHLILSWDVFCISLLSLAWATILTARPRVVLHMARLQHSSRTWIFLFVLISACASLAAVFLLLPSVRHLTATGATGHVVLALATVLLSWAMIHTIFTLHYAYLYYCRHSEGGNSALVFPEGKLEPDYFDFAYFSFIIGMTSQVSDIQIASKEIRRWALLHGLIAFAFNVAVLALGINIASGLFGN